MNLKEIRVSRGWSQISLAEKIGVSRSTIAMWETGGSQPDNDNLIALSKIFDVSIDYLLGRTNEADLLYKTAEEKYYLDKFSGLTIEEQKQILSEVLSEKEKCLISAFRSLNEQGQEYILDTINLAMLKYTLSDEPSLRIAAAPDITPAKIDIASDEVKHS